MLYMRVRPASFLSRSLSLFARAPPPTTCCAQAPPPAGRARSHPTVFCLVPAAAADSAAVARGDGDGAGRTVVVDVGPPVPGAVPGSRRRATRPTRVQVRGEVVVAVVPAIIEPVAGAHVPLRAAAPVVPVQHGAAGASGLVSWDPITLRRIRQPGPGTASTRAGITGGAACLHGDEGPAVRRVGAARDVVGIVKAIRQEPRLTDLVELWPSELRRAGAGVAADAVGAGARVLAGAVPAVVERQSAASAASVEARLRGGDAGRVRVFGTVGTIIRGVGSTGVSIYRGPVGVVLARRRWRRRRGRRL
eukprot:COSAG06_NODE_5514_length_3431_cov_27.989496_1_plen_306_part_00